MRASPSERAAAEEVALRVRDGLIARGYSVELPSASATAARGGLHEAQTAFFELRVNEAVALFDAWVDAAAARAGAGLDRTTWIEGVVWQARAHLAAGESQAADAALDRACRVDPALALDPQVHPPAFAARAAARCRDVGPARAAMQVRVVPAEARVFVDAQHIRSRELSLPPGRHLVRVEAPGFRTDAREVEVDSEGTVVEVTLASDPMEMLAHPNGPGEPLHRLRRAARELERDLLMVDVQRAAAGFRLSLRDDASRRSIGAGPTESVAAAVSVLLARWDSPLDEARLEAAEVDPWPWVAIGAGVAAAIAIGITVGVVVDTLPNTLSASGGRVP